MHKTISVRVFVKDNKPNTIGCRQKSNNNLKRRQRRRRPKPKNFQ